MIEYYRGIAADFITQQFGVPEFVGELASQVVKYLGFKLLDLNYLVAKHYTPSRFIEEMQGIADGSGGVADYHLLRRLNFIPELIKAHCTIVGAWGPATADGKLYHYRGLDWDHNAPVSNYPAIVIYEPSEPGSNTFANIGFLGLIGSLTGMSKNGISIGEKVSCICVTQPLYIQ